MDDQDVAVEEEVEGGPEGSDEHPTADGWLYVSAKIGKDGVSHGLWFNFGKDLEDATEKFTAPVEHSNARANQKVTLQAVIRRYIKLGKDVSALATTWKPGITLERESMDPKVAMVALFKSMDDAARQEFLQDLRDGADV